MVQLGRVARAASEMGRESVPTTSKTSETSSADSLDGSVSAGPNRRRGLLDRDSGRDRGRYHARDPVFRSGRIPSWPSGSNVPALATNRHSRRSDWRSLRTGRITSLGHDGPLSKPAFDPTGTRIAAIGHDRGSSNIAPIPTCGSRTWERRRRDFETSQAHGIVRLETCCSRKRGRARTLQPATWSADGRVSLISSARIEEPATFSRSTFPWCPRSSTRGDHEVVEVSFSSDREIFAILVTATDNPGEVDVGSLADPHLRIVTRAATEAVADVELTSATSVSSSRRGTGETSKALSFGRPFSMQSAFTRSSCG